MPYRIGPLGFRTQQDIRVHLRHLFDKYAVDAVVDDDNDHEFLIALLERHPERDAKVGCGVHHFSREQNPDWPTPGFRLHRLDGSSTDFSTAQCISGKGPSLMAQFREACKYAVDVILRDHKFLLLDRGGGRVQAPSGEWLGRDECRLEQVSPSWSELVDGFLAHHQHVVTESDITQSADNQYHPSLTSKELADKFRDYYVPRIKLAAKRITRTR